MLDQLQRQMAGNGSDAHQDKARRFCDAALPLLDDVYTLARYLLRDTADAEDAVQECYLRALRHFDTFRGPAIKLRAAPAPCTPSITPLMAKRTRTKTLSVLCGRSRRLDHLAGAGEQHRRHFEADGLRRLQIDHQLELRRRPFDGRDAKNRIRDETALPTRARTVGEDRTTGP
jgi:Sigma-70 region 2